VLEAMLPFLTEEFGNPSSIHSYGARAAKAVAAAREQVAALLRADPSEIVFTSGGTEGDNWALTAGMWVGREAQPPRTRLVVSAVEHHAVLNTARFLEERFGVEAAILPVDERGVLRLDSAQEAIDDAAAAVSVMLAGNETGSLQPVARVSAWAREAGALMHTDAVQAVGKIPVDVKQLGVDLLSLSAHKFYGPKGVGALYVRRGLRVPSFVQGGSQGSGRRAGTLNVAAIVGMGAACGLAEQEMEQASLREKELVERLWTQLVGGIRGIVRNGHPVVRMPGILSVCIPGVEGESCVLRLDRLGIACSSGSACAAGSTEESHVLRAMGVPAELARGALRMSLGRSTRAEEVDRVAESLIRVVAELRSLNPAWRSS